MRIQCLFDGWLSKIESGSSSIARLWPNSRLAVSSSFLHLYHVIAAVESTALGRLLCLMSKGMSLELARELVALKGEENTQQRYDYLATGRSEGNLSQDEEAELQDLVQVNSMLSMLKAEARLLLGSTVTLP